MLDVRKLRMLSALERLGTIAAVAEELHLTAPGISMQLSALERELGVSLTERHGRRLALTPAGRVLAAHGRDILDRLALAEMEVDAIRGGQGREIPSGGLSFRRPDTRLRRVEGHPGRRGRRRAHPHHPGAGDSACTAGRGRNRLGTGAQLLKRSARAAQRGGGGTVATEPIWLAIRSDDPHAGEEVDLADLARHPWITPERHLTCFEMTDRACGLAGFRPAIVAETMDFAAQFELVRAGAGVALVPQLSRCRVTTRCDAREATAEN